MSTSKKEAKLAAQQEEARKNKKFQRIVIITVVCLLILAVLAFIINSNLFYNKLTAVQIGDTSYSATDLNYYYRVSLSSFTENAGDYVSLYLDTTVPLDEQECLYDGYETWADYFTDRAISQMVEITAMYDAAIEAGYSPDDSVLQVELDNTIASTQTYASLFGYDIDAYLALTYGKGMTAEEYRRIIEKQLIATSYASDLYEGFEYSDDELETYYSEHSDELDTITYHSYLMTTANANFIDMDDETKAKAMKEASDIIAQAKTGAEFTKAVQDFVEEDMKAEYEDETSTRYVANGGNISEDFSGWLLDPERKEGDTTIIESALGNYILLYVSRNDNHYNTVDVRHLLVKALEDDNGEYTEESIATAKSTAEYYYEVWQARGTEEYFIEMVGNSSMDDNTNSYEVGGLYEKIYKGQMVSEFNDFCFDESRQPGDTAIVYGENDSYKGYHIVYFVGENELYSDLLADNSLRNADYNAAMDQLTEGYDSTVKFAARFTTK